jgi:hypothetical protein
MSGYSVDDIAEMAIFTRQDGHTDRQAHGGAVQASEWSVKVSCGEVDCQGRRLIDRPYY